MAELSMACLNWWTALFFVSLVNLWTYNASGTLIVKPQDTHVLAGQVTTLNCSTSLAEDVHWYYETVYIYAGKKLYHPYIENFKVEVYQNDTSTAYNLVFLAAKPEDAGTYNCRDNQGRGDMSSAEMTVFTANGNWTCQSNMKQDGVVVPNDCNIDPDEVLFSCSVTFIGKNPPQLEWKKVLDNGNSVINTECKTANNRVTCNASIIGDQQMNHSSYVCQTTGSSQLNIKLCTIEVKNLIYAFSATIPTRSNVGHEVQCSSNTSQPCQYKWKHSEVIVSTSRSITPVQSGLYQCEADCNIRGKLCRVFDYAYISQDYAYISQSSDESASCSTACVLVICLAIVLLIVSFSFCFLLRRERTKNQKLSNEGNSKENGKKQEREYLMQLSNETKTAHDEPNLIRTLKADAENKEKAVFGVTILGNDLYVLIMGCLEIEVFERQKLENRSKCSLNGYPFETPWDIQASSQFQCLYIVDERKSEHSATIVRIDPKGNFQKKWPAECEDCRLSITHKFNVIVTSLYNHSIREYTPDGELICEIALALDAGTSIFHPWVTLKQSTDEYIVSHGNRGDSHNRVCVIDQKGNLKHQFGGLKGSGDEQLNVPVHMATFFDGHILVTDKDNNRVVLLSPKLEFIGAFFSKSLRFPNRICLDEQNKLLFVADNQWISSTKPWNDGRVLVYNMETVQESLHKHGC